MINLQRMIKRPVFTVGSLFSITIMMVLPCHADKAAQPAPFQLPKGMEKLLYENCYACHDEWEQEGDIRLDQLATLEPDTRLDLFNKVQEQIYFGQMPPKKEKIQPTDAERTTMLEWFSAELKKHNASKLEDKKRMPEYANYVDHGKLFSGEYKHLKAFTPDRRWLISEFIFDAKFNRILDHRPMKTIDGQRRGVIGDNGRRANLTNPFLLPTNTGVRYYANATLNGGHLLTMLTNAKNAAVYMTDDLAKRDNSYLPSFNAIVAEEDRHRHILASREEFLSHFIEPVLVDLYKEKHNALLPQFKSVAEEAPAVRGVGKTKKAGFASANPGRTEMEIVFRSMRKHQKHCKTDEELIRKCEQDWFYFGHNLRKTQARVTFLQGYMEEWRDEIKTHKWDQRYKPRIYRSLDQAEMKVIADTIIKFRKKGDRYQTIIDQCMAHWAQKFEQERAAADPLDDALVASLVSQVFIKIHERVPTDEEAGKYLHLTKSYIKSLGNRAAVQKLIQTLILRSDFVYRAEFGQGVADDHGRHRLSPRDASYALAYAITDSSPDQELVKAVKEGRLNTREDYKRQIMRMLKKRDQYYVIDEGVQRLHHTASITNLPIRKLRFFREFFGYPKMLPIFKDNKRFGGNYDMAKGRLVGEADRLVEHILNKDKEVIETLLNTEDFFVFHSGDNKAMKASSERIRRIYEYFKDMDWQNFTVEDLAKHKEFLGEVKMRGIDVKSLVKKGRRDPARSFKTAMASFSLRFDKGESAAAPYVSFPAHGPYNASTRMGMQLRAPEVAKFFNIKLDDWNYPAAQPAKMIHRKGILTHPAWLIAHAQNTETDPVVRGKWVLEKLLAGTVPDTPITVEAVVPEDHHNTMRTRLAKVTEKKYCWTCHERMNPLGYPFEMYDDFGRYRKLESLEHPDNLLKKGPNKGAAHVDLRDIYKTLPVDSKGRLFGTGDKKLDGEVGNAIELADRLSRSSRVRQSVVRHAFRYFMGRNEFVSDSKTLIDADKAYLESGGSFDALIVSLLTSDSFIYRKPSGTSEH
ncbi:MAG: DUF1588 domain-containing protein [Verrucomicrobiae bacterium]|nr:DUF1588 domain-containing protein [Verrucomicrobiae bacterium]NNJ44295.1 DUF1588 domain-containing protein [Akkermansiaceae bacterium]